MAPTRSIWACHQTRLEKSGAKGPTPVPSWAVGYALDTSFWLIAVTGVPYTFRSQMAKVERRSSTLATWPCKTPLSQTFYEGPWDFLRVAVGDRHAKSRARKLVAVLSFVLSSLARTLTRKRPGAEEGGMKPEKMVALMRSAPERYGSVGAALARPRHETAKKQSNAEETQR